MLLYTTLTVLSMYEANPGSRRLLLALNLHRRKHPRQDGLVRMPPPPPPSREGLAIPRV